MKNYKIYIIAIVAVGIGLLIGKLVFTNDNNTSVQAEVLHEAHSDAEIWTCSMHPQIRQEEPGACPICGMDLIPAMQSTSEEEVGFQMTANAVKLANIQTTVIGNSSSSNKSLLKLNGTIKANETKSASLVSHLPGRIEQLFVSYTGEQVNQGQKIATIYSPELITAQKELLEAQKIQDISPNLIVAAKNKLKYWKIGDQVIKSILDSGTVRETFTIYAEHTGVVSQKRVSVGDYLSTGEVLFDIQNLSNLWVLFDVYENDLPKVREGSVISFTTPVSNRKYNAKITFVNPVINPSTRAATIRTEVMNVNGKLKPDMFVTGELAIYNNADKLIVPKSAVLWTGERSVVYVKVPNTTIPSFEYREIEQGEVTPNGYYVLSGLNHGEEVVTNGAFVIDASSQLNNEISMMNKNIELKNASLTNSLPDYTSTTPEEFKQQLTALAQTYIVLKDAFVDSDVKKIHQTAPSLLEKLELVNMKLVDGTAHLFWMEQLTAIQFHTNNMIKLNNIEDQRSQFVFLSDAIINAIKAFGIVDDTFYVQNCPMADNNEGANWLSKNQKINNPYFGEAMMTCGSVQETIDDNYRNASLSETAKPQHGAHIH